ncbi:hypothetical protein M758_10G032200 [Ceratodon purpureus]|nr:hypothetical protein M758_10G032200 [Ceratodon purpureus]
MLSGFSDAARPWLSRPSVASATTTRRTIASVAPTATVPIALATSKFRCCWAMAACDRWLPNRNTETQVVATYYCLNPLNWCADIEKICI